MELGNSDLVPNIVSVASLLEKHLLTTHRRLLLVLIFILFGISLAARAQTALRFVAVAPCRVVDTRLPSGPFGGPPILGQESRDFAIPNGPCQIPNTAAAYSLNVTVVPHGPLGYLTVWPAGQQQPLVSTLNSVDGRIKANAAIVPAGSDEAISVFASNTTDVVLDIDGYFVSATDPSGLDFFPLAPCRVADTRYPNDQGLGAPYLTGHLSRDLPILKSKCSIPNTAQAYSFNFTAVPHVPLGYLTVWPMGQDQPVVSTLNALTATVVANAAIVPAGAGGDISAFASNDSDLVIDVNGYFAAPGSGGLSLYPAVPCRVLDTRHGVGQFVATIVVDAVNSVCKLPSQAQAYVFNATVVPPAPLGYLTLWPDGGQQPGVSTLNAIDAAVTSNMAIVPNTNGRIDAFASNLTQLVLDISSYFAPIAPSIATSSLPSGILQTLYSASLQATDGLSPYTWSLSAGSLPAGLSLSSSGVISGTPTTAGTSNFTVQVSDSESPPATTSTPLSLTVTAPLLVSLAVTPTNPSIAAGKQQQFRATGTYSDGSHQDLTSSAAWSPSAPAVATINNAGLATAAAVGSSTIQATSGSINGSTTLTVTSPPQVSLGWNASTSQDVVGYNAYRSPSSGGPYTKLNSSLIATTSYTDQGVDSGNTYYYVTTAVNSQGLESVYSNEAAASWPQ